MRELNNLEVMEVSGAGIYTDAHRAQYKGMVSSAIQGGLRFGAGGFAVGLVYGAIKGMPSRTAAK